MFSVMQHKLGELQSQLETKSTLMHTLSCPGQDAGGVS